MSVDLSRSIHTALEKALGRARQLAEAGRRAEAAAAYEECGRLARRYAGFALTAGERRRRQQAAKAYEDAAAQLRGTAPAGPLPPEAGHPGRAADVSRPADAGPAEAEPEEEYQQKILPLIHKSTVTWDQIGGLEALKRDIRSTYVLSLARQPDGVHVAAWRHILLYGPPGTGKTLVAAATSNGLEATFFNVKVGDVLSQYFGESPKLVSALFGAARRYAPAVVFLDEIDALAASRDASDSGAERRVLAQLLTEMDGLGQKGDPRYVLTIAATNAPWHLDAAVLSRFEKRVYVPLPDAPARQQILAIHLTGKGHQVDCPLADLVAMTEGLSGREIARLCTDAVAHMIADVNPDLDQVARAGRQAAAQYQLGGRPVWLSDFQSVRPAIGPAVGPDGLARYDRWRRQVEG